MLSKELKIGIFGGIISSIFVIIFIQPILGIIWSTTLTLGESVQANYINKIYKNAAIGDRNIVGHILLLLQLFTINLIASVFLITELAKNNEKFQKISKIFRPISTITIVTVSISVFITTSLSSGIIELNTSFNQRLTILSPFISDFEYKQFKSRWAQMHNQSDYLELVDSMEKRAANLKIYLPELRKP